jgi:hypothetical protein
MIELARSASSLAQKALPLLSRFFSLLRSSFYIRSYAVVRTSTHTAVAVKCVSLRTQ